MNEIIKNQKRFKFVKTRDYTYIKIGNLKLFKIFNTFSSWT